MQSAQPGSRSRSALSGFTLIELLIVVAIISILAAIALPNFLEAQIRAKVSRARSDLRTIATALEAYSIDNNGYPPNPGLGTAFYVTPWRLTTPVGFISSWPLDPFKEKRDLAREIDPAFSNQARYYDYYTILTVDDYIRYSTEVNQEVFVLAVDASGPLAGVANRGALRKYGRWLQWSVGPDGQFWKAGDDFVNPANSSAGLKAPEHLGWGYSFDVPYDATNGSASFGNVIRSQMLPEGTIVYQP